MSRKMLIFVYVLIIAFTFTSCDLLFPKAPTPENNNEQENVSPNTPETEDKKALNILLGYPDQNTKEDPTGKENFLITRNSYVLSYNDTTHNPNWVSWHLAGSDMGSLKRPGSFYSDPKLPSSWDKVTQSDYQYSKYGFSRGHMCPNADRNGDKQMQKDTFYMTNMVPQVQANNGGPWSDLEAYLQETVKAGKEAYIVSGPLGTGGEGYNDHKTVKADYISVTSNGRNFKINVPSFTWKVVLIIDEGNNDIERINNNIDVTAIGVLMPNSHTDIRGYSNNYEDYIVSIDFIEELTGFDFFANVNDVVESILENKNSKKDAKYPFKVA